MTMWLLALGLAAPALAGETPIKVVEESVELPAGLDPETALASVGDIARIFELYEPAIPWVPGVNIDLTKEVVSVGTPTILELPVSGSAIGKDVTERARVTATTEPLSCRGDGALDGRVIVLSFADSSYNIERRIDRIEITACLSPDRTRVTAKGAMYAGFLPEDPSKNGMAESIGSKAIQGAFIRQVAPIVDAVEAHWTDLARGASAGLRAEGPHGLAL